MWQGTVVGTVVRAPMLINCDLGPSLCCSSSSNGVDADQQIMLLGDTLRPLCVPVLLFAYLEILSWVQPYKWCFYFTLLSFLCPGASLPLLVGCAKVGTYK